MPSPDPPPIAELGMYSYESVRWAWDELWQRAAERVPWLPAKLAHSGDVHARWSDPNCVVNQVCAWPLVRSHRETHRVVGAFSLTIPEAVGHQYRAVLLARRPASLAELTARTTRAVANSVDSLSGWVSLLHATVGVSGDWPGTVEFTNTHESSLRTLARGGADLASIDAWSLALVARQEPDLLEGLHRVGLGPLVPSPSVTTSVSISDGQRQELTAALANVITTPDAADLRHALMVDGFTALSIDDYLPTLALRVGQP